MHFSQATIAAVVAAGFVSAAPTIEKRAGITDGKMTRHLKQLSKVTTNRKQPTFSSMP